MPKLTEEQVDDLIDQWHQSAPEPELAHREQSLADFLGWTEQEYFLWVADDVIPDMPEEKYKEILNKL